MDKFKDIYIKLVPNNIYIRFRSVVVITPDFDYSKISGNLGPTPSETSFIYPSSFFFKFPNFSRSISFGS